MAKIYNICKICKGSDPTRFLKKQLFEWACTHSKQQKKLRRVGLAPLIPAKLPQSSGPTPTQKLKKLEIEWAHTPKHPHTYALTHLHTYTPTHLHTRTFRHSPPPIPQCH